MPPPLTAALPPTPPHIDNSMTPTPLRARRLQEKSSAVPSQCGIWGEFLNGFTWSEILRRYIVAVETSTVSMSTFVPTLLGADPELAGAVQRLKTQDFLGLPPSDILAISRALISDVLTASPLEAKVSADADELARFKLELNRAQQTERRVLAAKHRELTGQPKPTFGKLPKPAAAGVETADGMDVSANGGAEAAEGVPPPAEISRASSNDVELPTPKKATEARWKAEKAYSHALAKQPVRRELLGRDRDHNEYWFFPGSKLIHVQANMRQHRGAKEVNGTAAESKANAAAEEGSAASASSSSSSGVRWVVVTG